jgi:hypothetical protein
MGLHRETPLYINLNKIMKDSTVKEFTVCVWEADEGDEGEGIWLMDFI